MANSIRSKLSETFDSTPTTIRWLLLIVAFVVVLVLLFLLTGKTKKNEESTLARSNRDIKLIITPKSVDFSKTKIGEKNKQNIKVNATYDAYVDSVTVQDSVDGFDVKGCKKDFLVNKDIPCMIDVTFAPLNPDVSGKVTLAINWHAKGDASDLNMKTDKIVIPVSAVAASLEQKTEPLPEPVVAPEPEVPTVSVIEPEPEPSSGVDDNVSIDPGVDDDVTIQNGDDPIVGGNENIFKPDPLPLVEPARQKAPEKCSDFAMPGYSTSGAHIGWIKPKDGRYEFHPFSDTECNNPTGVYNPDTGFITSIDGKGTKIGTDADHIKTTTDINTLPKLRAKPGNVASRSASGGSYAFKGMGNLKETMKPKEAAGLLNFKKDEVNTEALVGSAEAESVYSSMPYDRSFILRQFKPIPATIVSEVRADPSVYGCLSGSGECDGGSGIPVRATVDRNVYSDNGRTIIIPTGTLLMGYLKGELPGPYKSIGRMQIKWYQFIRPDGVEFNFKDDNQDPYSADSQGRVGVPGYGSTDYIEQMVMPMLTAIIPAAVNMIAPIADTFVNQIDLDNNTVVQSGTVRSSELAKNEVISAWNKVAQKLIVDALDNTVPPFSIAAGTRITVYSPVDLVATCGDGTEVIGSNAGKKCAFHSYGSKKRREWSNVKGKMTVNYGDSSWTGQVRSFDLDQYCTEPDSKTGVRSVDKSKLGKIQEAGFDYRTVLAYCQSLSYEGKTQAQYKAYYENVKDKGIQGFDEDGKQIQLTKGSKEYNEQVLGLNYKTDEAGEKTDFILNPFDNSSEAAPEPVGSLDCDGQSPDENGCCPGETFTDMGEQGFNCCPDAGGDCFPPLEMNN